MNASKTPPELRIKNVQITNQQLVVTLKDGRTIMVPLFWYPKLMLATPVQRNRWKLISDRRAITWPELDEDLSLRGLLSETARPAPLPKNLPSNNRQTIRNAIRKLLGRDVELEQMADDITDVILETFHDAVKKMIDEVRAAHG